MITQENEKRLAAQQCPLCGEYQDIILNGHIPDEKPGHVKMLLDKGYSFCNCRNIFYTDWDQNIEQGVYDPNYCEKYINPVSASLLRNYADYYLTIIKQFVQTGTVMDVGSVAPFVLDGFKEDGFETVGVDIVDHKLGGHKLIVGDFETSELPKGNSVIWASHVFEHFKNPIAAVQKAGSLLLPGGLLFVAMPDPYFIEWKAPHLWGHWHVQEHHILWDKDSFAEVLKENGFEILMNEHNVGYDFICIGDFHILAKKT